MKARVLSGIQPTGSPHIGNYLGALKNWAKIQYDYDSIYCIVDLHAITVYQKPEELRAKIEELAGMLLAIGIDPQHSSFMVQSAIPEHAELAWMLTCVTPVGWLERMTQFKAKSQAQETIGDGMLQYPVLMAADILLYQAAIVPVGDDQSQHLELARDIAQRFNSLYGETFTMPATHLPTVGARIMGLDDPEKKMSKSETGGGHAISLLDPPGDDSQEDFARDYGFESRRGLRNHGSGRAESAENFPGIQRVERWEHASALHRHALRRFEKAGGGGGDRCARADPEALSGDHVRTRLRRASARQRRRARDADRAGHGE